MENIKTRKTKEQRSAGHRSAEHRRNNDHTRDHRINPRKQHPHEATVISFLENYHERRTELSVKEYLLSCELAGTPEDYIEEMSFAPHRLGDRVQSSNISDPTARVAHSYESRMEAELRGKERRTREYQAQKREFELLDYCLRQLPDAENALLTKIYINRDRSRETVSRATAWRHKKDAIALLVKAYAAACDFAASA